MFARICDFWKAGQQLAIQNNQQDPVDEFTTLNSSPLPEDNPVLLEFCNLVNGCISQEFIHSNNPSHVLHSYSITRTQFFMWEPLREPLSITINCAHPDKLFQYKYIASHVFKKLYLEPLFHSHRSLLFGTSVTTSFNKESTAWRLIEGQMHFQKELEITLGRDLFFFLPGFHHAFLYKYNCHQHVSPAVKVYVIQQLCLHFRSHIAVFQKVVIFY